LPSPNQSLSLEEVSLPPGVPSDGGDSARKSIDGAPETDTRNDLVPTGADTVTGKTPIFLGKKRPLGEAESPAASHAQTPWYRTSFGALALVLALMALLYFALKRWAPSLKSQDVGLVRVMSRTVLGPRQALVLIHVGQRVILVGVSPDRIDRVCEFADAEEVAALTLRASADASRGGFSAWLDREAAQFVDSDRSDAKVIQEKESRSGSKALSDLLQKLRTTKV
jgi:flagellar biogenesis protein FliO